MKISTQIRLLLILGGIVLAPLSLRANVEKYFENFELLAKSEQWNEIIAEGTAALKIARREGMLLEEAKICAQLTSTAFYQGNYTLALVFASRCHELSAEFTDQSLFVRALYLESAVNRALAAKCSEEEAEAFYLRAVEIAEEAASIYSKKNCSDFNLKGKVYFNLGAAHADNPIGDLKQASECYFIALECFKNAYATDDVIRTSIRLGKVYLLQKNYDLSQAVIDEVRPQIASERIAMQADYLEAQLKFALHDYVSAVAIAKNGFARATALGAKEDVLRLTSLIQAVEAEWALIDVQSPS